MNIKEKALEYAIKAHGSQFRKAEKEKPAIVHLIDVGNILEKYGFDDNIVAAGYLHDILEDTVVTKDELLNEFGDDIYSLVVGASEEDRSLSWEERKLGTINRIKPLDFRHKAVILADKISNTDDLLNLFGRNGKSDFSNFNRGKDKKIWYWREAYKSLALDQDESHPMFIRLKRNLDLIATEEREKINIRMFGKEIDEDLFLRKLYYKGLEISKLNDIQRSFDTYVVCLLSTDEDSKRIINDIKDYFGVFDLNINFLNLSWSDEEIKQLSGDVDDTLFRKKIDERLKKLVGAVKNRDDLVFIDSDFCSDLIEFDKIAGKLDVKVLKLLRYYLDVVSQLINNTYFLEGKQYSYEFGSYYGFLEKFIDEQSNVFRYSFSSDKESSSLLCNDIVDRYKENQLCNIKKLIKKCEDVK